MRVMAAAFRDECAADNESSTIKLRVLVSRRGDVGPGRARPGARGQARTRLARAAVVDAARTLFLERGYGATTIEAISDLADVPPATVYRLFSSKRGILKATLDVSIVGDDEAVPLADRPHVRSLLADPDPTNQLAGFVAVTVRGELEDRADLPHPRQRGELGSRCRGAARGSESPAAGRPRADRALACSCRRVATRRSGSAMPPTSSTPSCPPRCTGSSSSTEDGRRSGTSAGSRRPSSMLSSRRQAIAPESRLSRRRGTPGDCRPDHGSRSTRRVLRSRPGGVRDPRRSPRPAGRDGPGHR